MRTKRFLRGVIATSVLLAMGCVLAGCDSMDTFELFDTKKKLPGERKPVFPEGVPGVTQGIPPEYMPGYKEPGAGSDPVAEAAAQAAPEVAPKPVASKPKPKPKPRPVTQQRQPAQGQAQAPQQPAQQSPFPPPQGQPQQAPWPNAPPASGTFTR